MNNQTNKSRPKIGIAISSNIAYRDLSEGKMIDAFKKRFDLVFIAAPKVDVELPDGFPILRMTYSPRWRRIIYNTAKGLIHYHSRRRWVANKEFALYRSFAGVSPKQRALLRLIIKFGGAQIIGYFLRFLLRLSAPKIIPETMRLDGMFSITSVESDFQDEIVREGRRLKLPLLAFQGSWDNVTMKTFMEKPPYLAVWGEQSFLIARFIHEMMPHQLFVTGTPRCDPYLSVMDKSGSRKKLNLPADKRIVLLCGTSAPFDEHTPLNKIAEAFRNNELPEDVIVLFRPHPQRIGRIAEPPFEEQLPHVLHAPDHVDGVSGLDFFPVLLSAVDAIISPFSTMAIEAASFGTPVLTLGYNHPNHANFDWERQGFELHNYIFRHGDWWLECNHQNDIINKLNDLLAITGSRDCKRLAISGAEMVFRTGVKSASERLTDAMETVVAGNDADNSYLKAINSTGYAEMTTLQQHRDKDG